MQQGNVQSVNVTFPRSYRTHQISYSTGSVQEMSCILVLKIYMKHKISDTTRYVQEISCISLS